MMIQIFKNKYISHLLHRICFVYLCFNLTSLQTTQAATATAPEPEIFQSRSEYYLIPLQIIMSHIQFMTNNIQSLAQSLLPFQIETLINTSHTESTSEQFIALTDFKHFTDKPKTYPNYKREFHFGSWVKNKKSGTCLNTRAQVLLRDNIGVIKYKEQNPCSVIEGQWSDPYAGVTITDAQEMQIDHMVPLKEAYRSGAYNWTFKERCLFGNYLGYKHHLLAVYGEENNNKGDQTPEFYLPPRQEYRCEYIKNWLAIKALWGLSLSKSETSVIKNLLNELQCPTSIFKISKNEILKQNQFFKNNLLLCAGIEKDMLKLQQKLDLKKLDQSSKLK